MTEFRDCGNARCRWHGLLAECFVPLNDPTPLCPECGNRATYPGMTDFPEEAMYCVSGHGYGGQVPCLKEAVAIVQKHKQGAVYQRLWTYAPYCEPGNLADEIRCACPNCEKGD